jgi:hypothetical protein
MGENGRRAVVEKYNWGVEEKKLIKLYQDLLEETGREPKQKSIQTICEAIL